MLARRMEEYDAPADLGEIEGEEDFVFPPNERRLITQPLDLSIQTLLEQWDNKLLILPEIQREYVWDNGKASRLIESLILNIPIPVLYFSETPSLSERTDSLRIARAVGRAQVVLLSSHFERYFYAVNEEAVDFVNAKHISATVLSSRLNFFILGIQSMISRQWIGRAERNGFCRSFRRMHGCGQVAARVHC
jgi:hypothetical protein